MAANNVRMKTLAEIEEEYPLHWHVWQNHPEELENTLQNEHIEKEKLDPRGCTPLMLAVKLCHLQCVKCLLAAKCNATYENDGWSIVQEAICTGNADILTAILEVRDLQRHLQRVTHVPKLLQYLLDAPDFYIEMKWEFTSWVPLMSRLCPSDTYKVYKRGANVRIDTTLLGFDNNSWQRGNRSYIFQRLKESALMIEIDHDRQELIVEDICSDVGDIVSITPNVAAVRARLSAPVIANMIEMDKINFERNKSGIWGWRSEKSETINGYNCKVYGASNVEFITKTRMDHLSDEQIKVKSSKTPFHSFLGLTDDDEYLPEPVAGQPSIVNEEQISKNDGVTNSEDTSHKNKANATPLSPVSTSDPVKAATSTDCHLPSNLVNTTNNITPEEYFSSDVNLMGREIGRPKKISTKVQRFKANLWLSEEYPIRLQEQVLPILDLMSTMASPLISKLKDFITMQLPAGFPIKVEIPLYHVLNACITFGNVFAMTTPVKNVSTIKEDDDRITCIVDDSCFRVPFHYTEKGSSARRLQYSLDEDDILQYAIAQSLSSSDPNASHQIENPYDQVDIWEALRGSNNVTDLITEEDKHLQRVLQESLCPANTPTFGSCASETEATTNGQTVTREDGTLANLEANGGFTFIDPDLALALRLSQQEQEEYEQERLREQEMLEKALKLSLQEH